MAEQTIDKLQVEVTATAKGTNAVFSQLEGQMRTLKRVLDAIDVSKLTALNKATTSVKPKVDTSGLTKAEIDAKNSVSKIQQALAGLVAYADKAKLGDSSMMTSFERKAVSVQSAIDALDAKFKQMGEIKLPTEAFSKVQAEMEKTESHLESLKRQQQEMTDSGYNPAVAQNDKWDNLVTQIKTAEEEFARLKAIQDNLVNSGNAFSYPMDAYKEAVGATRAELEQLIAATREAFNATQQKPDNSGLDETKNKANEAAEALRKMFQTGSLKLSSQLGSALHKIGNTLSGIKDKAKQAADKGFMKLLKYGFGIRSVYVLFRRLRKAVVESFGELQNSGAFFETTRANIEALKASLTTLKFQFGAAFEPIFNAVAPALQTLVNYLITVMNVLSAFTAKLMGKSTYSKAVANMTALGGATGGAAKAQKELNKQLQGFDELNNLTTNNPGGGGGGGAGGDSSGAHYVEESVDSVLGDFGKQLADQIRAGDWEGVGQTISDKLSDAMESIKWDDVYAKARGFGKGLADFLNGLINPRLFGNLGTTLANSINTAFEFLNSFGTTFDWTNFGTSIGTGITNFFQNADFALWGSTVHTWIAGLLDAGISLVDNTDWALIGTKLGDFLENLNIPDLVTKLGKLAVKIAEGLGEALLNLAGSGTAGAIAASIATVLGGLVFWGKLGNLASNIGAALGITNWSGKIPKSCGANMLGEIETQLEGGSLSLGTLTLLVGEFVLVGNIASAVLEKLYLLFGDEEGAEYQREYGTPSGQVKALGETWDFLVDKSKDFFSENGYSAFDTSGSSVLDKAGKRLGDLWDWISGLWSDTGSINTEGMEAAIGKKTGLSGKFGLASSLGNAILGKTGNAKNNPLSKALDTITKKFQTADKTQTAFYNNTLSGSKKSGETLEKSYGDASEGVVHAITGARVDSDNAWANIGSKAKQLSNQFRDGFATLPSDTEKTFKSGYSMGTNQFKELANWAIQKSNEVSNGFNGMPSGVSSKFSTAYTESTNKWASTGTWATGVANTVKNAFNDTPSAVSSKFGTAYTESTNKFANTGAWAKGIVDTIKTKLSSVPDEFKSAFENARLQATARIVDFRTWFNNQTFKKTATLETSLPSTATVQKRWNEIANIWKNPEAITLKIEASGSNSFNINDVVGKLNSVIYELNSNLDTAVNSWKQAGIKIKSYSKMAYIQRRAARGGIVDMATPLLAGEDGTEAIVPLQNHTEWLGKMADMMVGEMAKPQHLNIASSITTTPYSGTGSSDIAEQNALLREEVQLLRKIADKELVVSSKEVFDATRSESNNYYNRTGNSPFLF